MNPLVEQFRLGGVPRDLRLMAAQGLLPLKEEDLLEMWTDLVGDSDLSVSEAASGSLTKFPASKLLQISKEKATASPILAWVVTHRPERELREVALQNPSLADEIIVALAPTLPQELAELVVINQVRLLRSPAMVAAITSNPALSNDQKRRLTEFRQDFSEAAVSAPPKATPPPPPPPEPEEPVLSEEEAQARYLGPEERADAEKVSTLQKIYLLSTAEKTLVAIKGSREERAILIRDPNRLVCAAVLSSPRLTEAEIESFSAMTNVSDYVLRVIGGHPEWTKRYAIMKNLVCNPHTPIEVALRFVPRLNQRDLRSIAKDRNVREAIRRAAQKFIKGGA
jgi:hypothetical protein